MPNVTVRHRGKKNLFIHNDLLNAAHYYRMLIDERLKRDDRKGIAFDCMSCLILLAFSFEATVNFFGIKKVADWRDRVPFNRKVETLFAELKLSTNATTRPYSTIDTLKTFRDLIAHGKPMTIEYDDVRELPAENVERPFQLQGDWERWCTPDVVFQIYKDVDQIVQEIHERSKIGWYDTLSTDESSMTLVPKTA